MNRIALAPLALATATRTSDPRCGWIDNWRVVRMVDMDIRKRLIARGYTAEYQQ
jgi:hypothetical protein